MADPWHNIQKGDRFYLASWNRQEHVYAPLWYEVTDLWFDPVRGQYSKWRGYLVAVRLMGRGDKCTYCASTIAGKGYVSVEKAEAQANEDATSWTKLRSV